MNRKLTREETIRLHREMWQDMRTELGDEPGPYERMDFKKEWVQEHFPNEHINSNCFLCEYANCEYAKQLKITKGLDAHYKCDYCPIAWNSNDDPECAPGYDFFWDYGLVDYRYSSISEILVLPEREVAE